MPTVPVYNAAHEKVGTVELDDAVFAAEVKEHLFHMVVRWQLAGRRSGNHDTKRRAEISGGGRKPWKQKGTGRARQGSTRSPQWRGGGVVFGPHPRSHAFQLPKKVRRAALRSALSRRCGEDRLVVLDQLTVPEAKTRHIRSFLKAFAVDDLLVVVHEVDAKVELAARNIQGVTVLPVAGLNTYDVLKHKTVAITQGAIAPIVARLGEVSHG